MDADEVRQALERGDPTAGMALGPHVVWVARRRGLAAALAKIARVVPGGWRPSTVRGLDADRRSFDRWLLDALPLYDAAWVQMSLGWSRRGEDDPVVCASVRWSPEADRWTEAKADCSLPALSRWVSRQLPDEDSWLLSDAMSFAVIASWLGRLPTEEACGEDASRSFLLYGFDWQDAESILLVGALDRQGWTDG